MIRCRSLPCGAFARAVLFSLVVASVSAGCDRSGEQHDEDASVASEPVVRRDWPVPVAAPGGEAFAEAAHADMRTALATKEAAYEPRTHHLNDDGSPVYTNRLILESSPYLLQHAHNPVNWFPWGEEAFETARRLDRPVILSIGYSTCHWCHVMERESFEDVEIATFMNENFIAIKVDREERPDIDSVYMEAVRLLSGRGGWPMTAILTPDRDVFFGGTYFPARDGDRGSRMGFLSILGRLKEQYRDNREESVRQARKITQRLQSAAAGLQPGKLAGAEPLEAAHSALSRSFDSVYGGFGKAPKFPRSVTLEFLMRYHRRTGESEPLHMAEYTLERMASGGMYDHLGGGFHRYSTDARWLVPHFEKMLYDNAQLVVAYLEAYQITARDDFAQVARETLDYVAREMTSPEGGFYSATDADSPTPDGHEEEGWFFTWTPAEIDAVVGSEAGRLVASYYGVTDRGNFEKRNILHTPRPFARYARESQLATDVLRDELDAARAALYAVRSERPPPGKDTKIIAAWNGLMISAFARGALVLGEPAYADIARDAASFVLSALQGSDGSLARSWRRGQARHVGVLDDYAFMVAGLLDLYQATAESQWLAAAVRLNDVMVRQFHDDEGGGFFLSADDAEELLVREKPDYDGALPSGNSVVLGNLLELYELVGDERYRELAVGGFESFARSLERRPAAIPRMLSSLDFYLDRPKQVVIVKPDRDADAGEFLRRYAKVYAPSSVLAVTVEGADASELAELVPLVGGKVARDGKVTAYVCEQRVCDLPTTDPATFTEQISRVAPYPDADGVASQ